MRTNIKILNIVIFTMLAITGCDSSSEYNLGVFTTSLLPLTDVEIKLFPEGTLPTNYLDRKCGGWLMAETHWSIPEEVEISFTASSGKRYNFEKKLSLSKDFRGDILFVIVEQEGLYSLQLFTGKLGSLDADEVRRSLP